MCSCHSILECCVMFSGVKLSMGSFILFIRTGTKLVQRSLVFTWDLADPLPDQFSCLGPNGFICESWYCDHVKGWYCDHVKRTQFRRNHATVDPIKMELKFTNLMQTQPWYTSLIMHRILVFRNPRTPSS